MNSECGRVNKQNIVQEDETKPAKYSTKHRVYEEREEQIYKGIKGENLKCR